MENNQGGQFHRKSSFGGRRPFRSNAPKEPSEFDSKVLQIARVTRVTRGGKRFSFRATVVLGNGKGRVGVGIGKGVDVVKSIEKGTNRAKRELMLIPMKNGTIPHETQAKYNSAVVILRPATPGTGVKAGGPVRVVAKLAGIENIVGKIVSRTTNKINIARATILALTKLKNKPEKAQVKN